MKIIFENKDGVKTELGTTLPIASKTQLGGVKIGSGINVSGEGTISVNDGEWDDVIEIGTLAPGQIVSEEIASKLATLINLFRTSKSGYFIIDTFAYGYSSRYSSVRARYGASSSLFFTSYTNNRIIWGSYDQTTPTIKYDPSTKMFEFTDTEHFILYGAYIKYKYVDVVTQQNSSYSLQDINAISLLEEDNTYNFDSEEFKNKIANEPSKVFLTINEHEFRGFFLEDNLYKHIDNVYQLNEEINEQELVKTYTCTIDLTNNLITYNENDIINTTKEEETK